MITIEARWRVHGSSLCYSLYFVYIWSFLNKRWGMKKYVHLVHFGKQNCQMGTLVLHYAQTAHLVKETTTWKKSRPCPNATSFSKPSPNSLARGAPSFTVLQLCGITPYQLSSAALQVSPKLSSWKQQTLIISQFLRQFRHNLAGCLWVTGCNHVTIHSCGQWCTSDPLGCWPEMSISYWAGISAGQLITWWLAFSRARPRREKEGTQDGSHGLL